MVNVNEAITDREIDSLPSRIPNPMDACGPGLADTGARLSAEFSRETIPWGELSVLIHEWAVWKGWYETHRSSRVFALLFRSEVFEAFEEWRAGRMETWFSIDKRGHSKPEGFWIEIADVAIRILDYCDHMALYIDEHAIEQGSIDLQVLDSLHQHENALWTLEGSCFTDGLSLRNVLFLCKIYCAAHGQDLKSLIMQKMRYNLVRETRHGGKLV